MWAWAKHQGCRFLLYLQVTGGIWVAGFLSRTVSTAAAWSYQHAHKIRPRCVGVSCANLLIYSRPLGIGTIKLSGTEGKFSTLAVAKRGRLWNIRMSLCWLMFSLVLVGAASGESICKQLDVTVVNRGDAKNGYSVVAKVKLASGIFEEIDLKWAESNAFPMAEPTVRKSNGTKHVELVQKDSAYSMYLRAVAMKPAGEDEFVTCPVTPPPAKKCIGSRLYRLDCKYDWTRSNHPSRAMPENAHFSRLVVATHKGKNPIFSVGTKASAGLAQLVETGEVDLLMDDLRAKRRTKDVVATQNETHLAADEKHTIMIKVSARKPLLSAVTWMRPSPDWFIGVDAVNLCDDGVWITPDLVDFNLLAYDAGTDIGEDFISPKSSEDGEGTVELKDLSKLPATSRAMKLTGWIRQGLDGPTEDVATLLQSIDDNSCVAGDLIASYSSLRESHDAVSKTFRAVNKLMLNFRIIESQLVDSCDGLTDHRDTFDRMMTLMQPAALFPPLKPFLTPLLQFSDKFVGKILGRNVDTLCESVSTIRSGIDKVLDKAGKTVKAIKLYFVTLDIVEEQARNAADLYETQIQPCVEEFPTVEEAFTALCDSTKQLDVMVDSVKSKAERLLSDIDDALNGATKEMEKVLSFVDPIQQFFDEKLGVIFDPISELLNREFSLPFPRGSKERGIGEIPRCCGKRDNVQLKLDGILCRKPCPRNFENIRVLKFICAERCPRGWKPFFVKSCRKGFRTRKRRTFNRGVGILPNRFGDDACSCRKDKKRLIAGLCKNKCGSDSFKDFPVPFFNKCIDFSPVKVTLGAIVEKFDFLDRVEQIPGLGDALKFINRIIDKVFEPLVNKINEALSFDVDLPDVDFSVQIPSVDTLLPEIDLALDFDLLENFALKFESFVAKLGNQTCAAVQEAEKGDDEGDDEGDEE